MGRNFETLVTRLLELRIHGKVDQEVQNVTVTHFKTGRGIRITVHAKGSSVAKFNSMELSAIPVPRPGSDVLCIPRNSNFPFIDQVLLQRDEYGELTVVLFRCTVGRDYKPTGPQVMHAWSQLQQIGVQQRPLLVWVTWDFSPTFTEQKLARPKDGKVGPTPNELEEQAQQEAEFAQWHHCWWKIGEGNLPDPPAK